GVSGVPPAGKAAVGLRDALLRQAQEEQADAGANVSESQLRHLLFQRADAVAKELEHGQRAVAARDQLDDLLDPQPDDLCVLHDHGALVALPALAEAELAKELPGAPDAGHQLFPFG